MCLPQVRGSVCLVQPYSTVHGSTVVLLVLEGTQYVYGIMYYDIYDMILFFERGEVCSRHCTGAPVSC